MSNSPTHGLKSWSDSCCMEIRLAAYEIVIYTNLKLTDWYYDMEWKRSSHVRMGWLVSCCMRICRLAARIVIYTNHTSTVYMNTRIWDEICRLTGRSMDRCICVTWLVYISRGLSQWEVGGWGRVPFSRKLMSPTPRRKWYLTTGRRAH